jgi:hypothetical protein
MQENKIAFADSTLKESMSALQKSTKWLLLVVIVLGSRDSEKGSNLSFATPDQ